MPDNKNPYLQQFQPNNDPAAPVQPSGDLTYVPTTPEVAPPTKPESTGAFTETAPSVEVRPTPEVLGQPPAQPDPQATTDTIAPATTVHKSQPKPNIQDKTAEVAPLHHVQNVHDKLTSIADTEEEEFISEVETAHGHK
ncbi:hypothetical protein A2415_05160 [candidate division WWE3 bacterium RIFOXYC1_FULL_39_7]|uniref:Uncharacterized protein n=2 Tax=Katanobacteria TaxID=422282 RepID=A0A1F4X8I8_UNCKA|nr:MAG: hypothetical protein A2415_05160 [candidate division WWE3 bacterium RIFOXYC1_FULL_39_7]OGC77959.1 MAG: hypothetical protein A2619_00670 [candidate division WWE3 bacterium RIFOXYD1_FULL_39_9]